MTALSVRRTLNSMLEERSPMGTKEIFSTVAEAAEHLNAIIEYSFDGIFITDKNCNVLRINHSYEEITGLTKDEILGKNMADLVQQLEQTSRRGSSFPRWRWKFHLFGL